jgi:low affinity Fe/Cu permease
MEQVTCRLPTPETTPRASRASTGCNSGGIRMAKERSLAEGFQVFATKSSYWVGSRWAFALAVMTIFLWGVSGPHFHYSDTWQLVVNTATTIVTFLMVFLIQNTQNRDAKAIHLKLDEIIRAIRPADNNMINIEKLSDDELQVLAAQFEKIRAQREPQKKTKSSGGTNRRSHT